MSYLSLNMILSSSLLILVVAGLGRLLGHRLSPRLRYGLWLLVALRLLLPFDVRQVDFSVSALAERAGWQERIEAATLPNEAPANPETNPALPPAESGDPAGQPTAEASGERVPVDQTMAGAEQPRLPLAEALFWLWLAGAGLLILWQIYVNLRFNRGLRQAERLEVDCPLPVYLAEQLPSPCLFGVLRPRIYLNQRAEGAALEHILTHELCHWRQGDQAWALVRALCLSLHWFNPLVWLAASLSRRDGELACDQAALKILGDGERVAYGETLLALLGRETAGGKM